MPFIDPFGSKRYRQVQVDTKLLVLVADVALEDSQINESSVLHCRYVLCIVGGDHVDV